MLMCLTLDDTVVDWFSLQAAVIMLERMLQQTGVGTAYDGLTDDAREVLCCLTTAVQQVHLRRLCSSTNNRVENCATLPSDTCLMLKKRLKQKLRWLLSAGGSKAICSGAEDTWPIRI